MRLRKRLFAEFIGTTGLLAIVVGSGIMGETLAQGNVAIALLANSLATGAGLFALIQTFGPISGAHFNPVVSLSEFWWNRLSKRELLGYCLAQVIGAVFGVWLAHVMFGQSVIQFSSHARGEFRFFVSEVVATAGLLLVIALSGKKDIRATPLAVALYITSAYWFTSSTSFANPAVTIARCFTDTFAGIQWNGAPSFILAQIFGTVIALLFTKKLS